MTTSATAIALEAHSLRKTFGPTVAVRDLSLSVGRGEVFGFLGPNGAGKSTTVKMLLGLVTPSGGEASLLGAPIGTVDVRRRVGFLPEDFRFYDWLTAAELVHFHGQLSGMSASRLRERVPAVLEQVGLAPNADRRIRGFSKGMVQRLGLAQALVHEPDIVFLDEPTSGLDPMGRLMVRDILRTERERGATVFLNSHLLGEVEVTCDRVVFIKNGQVVASQDLRESVREDIRVVVEADKVTPHMITRLGQTTSSPTYDSGRLSFGVRSRDALPEVMRQLVSGGADVYSISQQRVSLEEMFVKIMGEDSGL